MSWLEPLLAVIALQLSMEGSTVDKALLFKPRLPEDEVEIPGVGTVRVRALNREEAKSTQKIEDPALRDLHIIAIGMVDPQLSVSEVKRWAEASPASEMEPVANKIAELSGMLPDSPKRVVTEFEANPDAEFRALPSGQAVDDGGSTPGGTE